VPSSLLRLLVPLAGRSQKKQQGQQQHRHQGLGHQQQQHRVQLQQCLGQWLGLHHCQNHLQQQQWELLLLLLLLKVLPDLVQGTASKQLG
jgi:hypothetical protein